MSDYIKKEQDLLAIVSKHAKDWKSLENVPAKALLRIMRDAISYSEAAKATGTAGELPPLPEAHDVKGPHGWLEYHTADQMREYGQACAEAARSLAISQADYNRDMDELAQDFEPVANMDLLKAKLHIVGLRKRLKNVKAKAEAAPPSAPVVAVKTWQERQQEHFAAEMFSMKDDADFMELEIADLRRLAATAAPVMQPEMKKIGWMWKKWGWTVTAHSKHREIHRVMDFNQPPESTKLSPDFISLEPIYIAATNRSQP